MHALAWYVHSYYTEQCHIIESQFYSCDKFTVNAMSKTSVKLVKGLHVILQCHWSVCEFDDVGLKAGRLHHIPMCSPFNAMTRFILRCMPVIKLVITH